MSLFPAYSNPIFSSTMPSMDDFSIPLCKNRPCTMEPSFKNAIYSTALLKSLETITTVAVLIVSSVLLLALLTGVRRFTMPFFKILTVLVAVIVIRSAVGIVFKLVTLWSGLLIPHQNIITLVIDMVSKRLLILLIFLLALNRFVAILYTTLDSLLFARYRYIALCLVCFVIAAAETYIVITMSNLRREFIVEIGFVDFIDSAEAYEIGCMVFLAIASVSVCLHLTIIVYLRYHSRKHSEKTAKIRQRMFREIALMAIVNTMFTLLFILLYRIPSSNESRIMIISIYNILCFIPDILIPVFILIGSSEVHAEISSRFSRLTRAKRPSSRKTVTMK